jgi:signal transduction histidine kinase
VRYTTDAVTVAVNNDAPSNCDAVPAPRPGGGHGLVGVRERAAIVGGETVVGPDGAGGFTLQARLPRHAVRS